MRKKYLTHKNVLLEADLNISVILSLWNKLSKRLIQIKKKYEITNDRLFDYKIKSYPAGRVNVNGTLRKWWSENFGSGIGPGIVFGSSVSKIPDPTPPYCEPYVSF